MIDAGLPLVQCLEILAGQQENKTFQKILNGVRASVEGGATLSAAMKQYDKVFDRALLQHGGSGRDGRYSGHHSPAACRATSRKNVKLKRAVKSAMIYPIAVLGIAAVVIILAAVEGRADFRHFVQRPWRGPAAAHPNRDRMSNFVGSIYGLLILVFCRGHRCRLEVLVRHATGRYRD